MGALDADLGLRGADVLGVAAVGGGAAAVDAEGQAPDVVGGRHSDVRDAQVVVWGREGLVLAQRKG